jgi:hypothetical protein
VTKDPDHFNQFGLHAAQSLYDLQQVSNGDILQMIVFVSRQIAAKLMKKIQSKEEWEPDTTPSTAEVSNY